MSIYQEIWDADQAENGIVPLRAIDADLKDDEKGYVIVDETIEEDPDQILFPEVVIPSSKIETYELCARLFNNYALDPAIREDVTISELAEETTFIDAILDTGPIKVAKDFLEVDLGREITDNDLIEMIRRTWFLQGNAGTKFASGFEHIFVGEQKPSGNQPDNRAVDLGGYHFWYKYYLDDGGKLGGLQLDDRIKYRGTRYDGPDGTQDPENKGLQVPEIVTLSYEQDAPDFLNNSSQRLKKPIGGFWVGCSPEGLIALGLIRVWSSAGSNAVINSATYDVKFFPLDDNPRSIRSFFPIFKRADFRDINPGPEPDPDPDPGQEPDPRPPVTTNSTVKIIAALVNPFGNEAGQETVTLLNTGAQAANLDGWKIQAPNEWQLTFADVIIGAGDSRRFQIVSPTPQLRNRAGNISLIDKNDQVRDQVQYSDEQADVQGITIKF